MLVEMRHMWYYQKSIISTIFAGTASMVAPLFGASFRRNGTCSVEPAGRQPIRRRRLQVRNRDRVQEITTDSDLRRSGDTAPVARGRFGKAVRATNFGNMRAVTGLAVRWQAHGI
jgi:hypothetical protein